MGDLALAGPLNLMGALHLCDDGGILTVNGADALVEGAAGTAVAPVLLPPPPAKPVTESVAVEVVSSLGKTVDTAGTPLVTLGLVLQGEPLTWPGMVLPSTGNSGPSAVLANGLPVNVEGDRATIFPNGGSATLDDGGQG